MTHQTDPGPTRQYNLFARFQQDLLGLLESSDAHDIHFLLPSTPPICAHSAVIAVRCRALRPAVVTFLATRTTSTDPHPSPLLIPVRPVAPATFRNVLRYLYTGSITLSEAAVYDVSALAGALGVDSLQQIVFSYLQSRDNVRQVAPILDRALQAREHGPLVGKLTAYVAENCATVLRHAPFHQLSRQLMVHLLKQENLWASERDIWTALVEWCCARCGVDGGRKISEMARPDCVKVAREMGAFCKPEYLRILNFDAAWFSQEVEPLGVFPAAEVLLKYRFEATAGMVGFDNAFPLDRYSFLRRIRQRTMCFESSTHPHPRGVSHSFEVQLPVWVSETKVVFDSRTALGRYADLEFFADEEKSQRIFSVRASRQSQFGIYRGRVKILGLAAEPEALDPVIVHGNTFWCSFYAPKNVGDLAWGYKFFVSIVR